MEVVLIPSSLYRETKTVADGGGTISFEIPEGGRLWYVGVAPEDVSIPDTSVLVDLVDRNGEWVAQVLPLDVASSDATFRHAHSAFNEILLPDDRPLVIQAQVFNLTGVDVRWVLSVIVEVDG